MSRRHGYRKSEYDRVIRERSMRERETDREKAERCNTVCTCGAITALNPCPFCEGERAS